MFQNNVVSSQIMKLDVNLLSKVLQNYCEYSAPRNEVILNSCQNGNELSACSFTVRRCVNLKVLWGYLSIF